jgi:bifunctional oligoribonuclease and PAP phosphatase NrnA
LALGVGLMAMGKRVTLYNADGVPSNMRFLPYADRIVRKLDPANDIDALVIVDCAQPKRAGDEMLVLSQRLSPFYIDHHIVSHVNADEHCVDPDAAACGELIYRVLQALHCQVTPEIATHIYTALVTDTGHFRYSNTTKDVLSLAAELVGIGVSPWQVAMYLDEQTNPVALTLLQLMLETLSIDLRGRFAHVTLTQQMFHESQALPEHAEDFVNYPRSIAGVEVASLFRELPDGRWKVSLRSKEKVDVAAIAAGFDGGGHQHAAGCTLATDLASARKQVEGAVEEALSLHRLL